MVCHSSDFLNRLFGNPRIGSPTRAFVTFVQPLGHLGVELFFVLSGFLIGRILINTFLRTDTFSFRDIRRFWIRRWFRTLPLYWLVLTVDILLFHFPALQKGEGSLASFYVFLQNLWYPNPMYFFGEAWSLSIEEWFYLTLPIAMLIGYKIHKPSSQKRFLLTVFLSYLSVFLLARFVNAFHPINGPDVETGIRKVVVFRLDAIMFGVLFAWLHHYYGALMARIRYVLLLFSCVGVACMYYLLTESGSALCNSSLSAIFLTSAFLYLLMPLSFSLCLPFANSIKSIRSNILSRFFTHISNISYSMYLIHYMMIYIYFYDKLKLQSTSSIILLYMVYWIVVIGLSSLLYKYYEHPIMKWRDRFTANDNR